MSPCEAGYLYVPVAFLATLYLVYLVECWHCTARHGSSPKLAAAELEHRARQMRDASPVVWWKAVCYHYVRRKRQVTRYRHGDAYTSTQAYYERVDTHAAGGAFAYQRCGVRDESPELVLDPRTPITHVRFSKGFAFANVEAADEFEEQRSRFFSEHERQDDYMELREGLALTGVSNFRERVVAYTDPDRPPWFARPLVFWLASCLLLSWPLRLIQEANTAHLHYRVTKVFGVNYEEAGRSATTAWTESECEGGGGRARCVSRESTVTSCDTALWDQAIAPSYSEALLMASGAPAAPAATIVSTDAEGNQPPTSSLTEDDGQLLLDASHQTRRPRGVRGLAMSFSTHSVQTAAAAAAAAATSLSRTRLPSAQSSPSVRVMYLAAPLEERQPRDPFNGRAVTTPTDEPVEDDDDEQPGPPPPSYDDALRFPALTRLKRSLTDRDMCRCACVESVLVTERVQVHSSNTRRPRSMGPNMETSL